MSEWCAVVTLYRRYWECRGTLAALHALRPGWPVVLVWACPEEGRRWWADREVFTGRVADVVERPPLPSDGGPTTGPESVNLRLGLTRAAELFPGRWCLGLAGDVTPLGLGLEVAEAARAAGERLCCCDWGQGGYHTNWFAVPLADPAVWPPVSPPDAADTLEMQWAKHLRPAGVAPALTTNAAGRVFRHTHASEAMPAFPVVPQTARADLPGLTRGRRRTLLARLVGRLFRRPG